jgi:hypothetical protein
LINYILNEEKQNEELVNITTTLLRSIIEIDSGFLGDFILSELKESEIKNQNLIIKK